MTAVLSFQAAQYPADTRHAPHEHAALQLSLVLAGRVVETVGRVTEHAGALSVVCKAAGVVHANVFGREGARLARLTLADGDLASLLDDAARASDWRWTHDPAVAAPFLRLVQHATTRAATFDSTCDTTRDTTGDTTIAADDPDLLDLLAAFSARPVRPRSGEAPAWLAETRDRMIAEWTPLMTVGVIARQAGVHPVYLARCMRRWYGVSVGSVLRTLRLRAAVSHCHAARRSISDAAHAAGYADEAHFNRALRAATGLTPARYRNLVDALDCRVDVRASGS
jgi:AraC family transcriptional regulator